MLFLPLSALLLLLPPLYFVHGVSGGSRVKSSEETLIGSDFSLSRLLPPALPPLLLLLYSSSSPHVSRELTPPVSSSNARGNISA